MFILNKDNNNEVLFVINVVDEIDSHNFAGTLSLTMSMLTDKLTSVLAPKWCVKACLCVSVCVFPCDGLITGDSIYPSYTPNKLLRFLITCA